MIYTVFYFSFVIISNLNMTRKHNHRFLHNLENVACFFSIIAIAAFITSSLCSIPWFHRPWQTIKRLYHTWTYRYTTTKPNSNEQTFTFHLIHSELCVLWPHHMIQALLYTVVSRKHQAMFGGLHCYRWFCCYHRGCF